MKPGTTIGPSFELRDKVCVDSRVAENLGLNSDIIYSVLAVKIDYNCKIDDEDEYCRDVCEFRANCRKGEKMICQLIAVGDVEEFYPASYFKKAS